MLFIILFSVLISAADNENTKIFDCVVIPSNVADLGSNARGVIATIAVDRNHFVKQGDVIAVLDDTVEKATVVLAEKKAAMDSEIKEYNINLTHAKREEKRAKVAYRSKAFSLHNLDKAKVATQLAKIKLLQAQEKQLLAQKKLVEAKARLAHRTIHAPFTGIVMEKFKTMGEYIDDDPVVRLAQLDPLYVELILPAAERSGIKVGMDATVCSDKNDGKGWRVNVSQVDKVIDVASGTFGVRLLLPNANYEIPAGIRCDLKFNKIETQVEASDTNTSQGETSRHG